MNESRRGMIKWAPYKSLVEQEDFLRIALREKRKVPKPQISTDKAEEINRLLSSYIGNEVIVTFYEDGFIYYIEDVIEIISASKKAIIIQEKEIAFKDIIDIENK